MLKQTCWTMLLLLVWLLTSHVDLGVGQSQNAIGAHRAFGKTSFSCAGRPAGYYADIETGCQVYHMCDGLGRQFSYSCPNTTLFQQRMLICDHWYMVNCSKAESDYAANLLIGQRDKPFVNDEESNLRTPRPDLLDRPYAPDYSGESFRKQYNKLTSATQNQIIDDYPQKSTDKSAYISQLAPGQQRWQIPPPSRTILPPAYEPQIEDTTTATKPKPAGKVRFITPTVAKQIAEKSFASSETSTTRRPAVLGNLATLPPTRRQNYSSPSNAALLQRQRYDLPSNESDDLGTSHSTRYNTSADFNSAETQVTKKPGAVRNQKTYSSDTSSKNGTKPTIKVPSKIYEPPFLYPIYNQEEVPVSTTQPLRVSTATPFKSAAQSLTSTTTTRPLSRPTTLAGKPFTSSALPTVASAQVIQNSSTAQSNRSHHSKFDSRNVLKDTRTPTPAQGFKPPTPRPPFNSAKTSRPLTTSQTLRPTTSKLDYVSSPIHSSTKTTPPTIPELPANDLLPPFQEFVQHDVATTQGPPIYYDWKIPSNGLEPPKLDPPIGVDGREYADIAVNYNSISNSGSFTTSKEFGVVQDKTLESNNKFLASNLFIPSDISKSQSVVENTTTKTPAPRSVKEAAQPKDVQKFSRADAISSTAAPKPDLTQIRKDLSVPEYLFPLEDIGRTGYLASDTYNSFQLKIPDGRNDNEEEHLHWFGENPKCPECHPSYVKPGTCEPCLRR